MKPRVAPFRATQVGRGFAASPDRFSLRHAAIFGTLFVLIGLQAAGVLLDDPVWTTCAGLALLILGLPHGSLDIATIAAAKKRGGRWLFGVLLLYLGCAAAMYAIWQAAPVAALGLFLAMAAIHFSEDWHDVLPPFLAMGTAIAMLAAPALVHGEALSLIFAGLTGSAATTAWADFALMIAPVALLVALAGVFLTDSRSRATETLAGLAAMIVLPPIIGFAVYFCLSHSPRHLASAVESAGRGLFGYRRIEMGAVTLAALGIAAAIFVAGAPVSLSERTITASFITLSILTVPHMLVPLIVAAFEQRWA